MKLLKTLAFAIFILSTASVHAQTTNKEVVPEEDSKPNVSYAAAEDLFYRGEFYNAIQMYQKAYPKEKIRAIRADIEFKIGECFRQVGDLKNAEEWYNKAVKTGYDKPIVLLWLADCMRANGGYGEALNYYKEYRQVVPDDIRAINGIKSCELAKEWIANPTNVKIDNVTSLNTKASDFGLNFSRRNNRIATFSSSRAESTGKTDDGWTGFKFYDIFEAVRDDKGRWSTPRPLPAPVNTEFNEGAPTFDKRGTTMLFTKCIPSVNAKGVNCGIFISRKRGENWERPMRLTIVADSITVGHPTLSTDEMALYFSSTMPGGLGGRDIYVSVYDPIAKRWGEPMNLGPKINTPGDEMFPYVKDDSTLFYASNGLPGMGGLDLFSTKYRGYRKFQTFYNAAPGEEDESEGLSKLTDTTLTMRPLEFVPRPEGIMLDEATGDTIQPIDSVAYLAQQWSEPENLRFPFNSNTDDFGVYFEEGYPERGFFASAREGGKGSDDIYSFKIPPLEFTIQGKVIDVDTRSGVKAATVELVGSDGSIISVKSDRKGNYIFDKTMVKPNTVYKLSAMSRNYLLAKGVQSTVGLTKNTDLYQDAFLLKSTLRPIELRDIYYDLGKATLRPESKVNLDTLVMSLEDNPKIVIRILSHTDSRGDDNSNLKLSQDRSQSVVTYLISRGIDKERLVATGMGETRPLITDAQIDKLKVPEDKEAAHQRNRRTEFEVVRSDYVPKQKGDQVIETEDGGQMKLSKPILSDEKDQTKPERPAPAPKDTTNEPK